MAWVRTSLFSLFIALVALPPARAEGDTANPTAVFDEVWRTVRDRFYDRDLHGLDWSAIAERYRPQAAAAASGRARAAVINRMLAELHASHTAYYSLKRPPTTTSQTSFPRPAARDRGSFPGGKVAYTGIGIFSRNIDGKTFVSGVLNGLPADEAGLLIGDELIAADGAVRAGRVVRGQGRRRR
jgi:carboxyl-terminal processing protease